VSFWYIPAILARAVCVQRQEAEVRSIMIDAVALGVRTVRRKT
jgi:hypothetical protein